MSLLPAEENEDVVAAVLQEATKLGFELEVYMLARNHACPYETVTPSIDMYAAMSSSKELHFDHNQLAQWHGRSVACPPMHASHARCHSYYAGVLPCMHPTGSFPILAKARTAFVPWV
jgi:hypothetical protein